MVPQGVPKIARRVLKYIRYVGCMLDLYEALVSELGKYSLGFVGVCSSIFNDNYRNGKAQKLCSNILIPKNLYFVKQNFLRNTSSSNIMIWELRGMFKLYFQPFTASLSKTTSATSFWEWFFDIVKPKGWSEFQRCPTISDKQCFHRFK